MNITTKIIILFLILVILGIAMFAFTRNRETVENIDHTKTVLVFGDSLVYGHGATSGNDFVSVLSRKLQTSIVNAGVPGDTTSSALKRLQSDVIDQKPNVVLVLLGGNDALQKISSEQTFDNLKTIVTSLQANGSEVVLLGVQGALFNDPYKNKFEELVKETKVEYVPNVLSGIFGRADLMSDPIHPNDKGYQKIADKIEPVLLGVLQK
jgi:acyl-CoA thioesterase I